ncbi:MAG: hypothetical protein ABSD89_05705 [Halobacteriota archaeon]|jgi:hypothetical protein
MSALRATSRERSRVAGRINDGRQFVLYAPQEFAEQGERTAEELRRLIRVEFGAFAREIESQFVPTEILGVPPDCKAEQQPHHARRVRLKEERKQRQFLRANRGPGAGPINPWNLRISSVKPLMRICARGRKHQANRCITDDPTLFPLNSP